MLRMFKLILVFALCSVLLSSVACAKSAVNKGKAKTWQPIIKIGMISKDSKKVEIKSLKVEEYLRGVLPKEMSPSFHEEALKAQAVAARTFALDNRKRHQAEGYDLCNTTHCQTYNGIEEAHVRTDKAIDDTFGEVLVYKNDLIQAPFHTDSGGMTESAVDVWGTDLSYLRASNEVKTHTMPWTVKVSLRDFADKLAADNKNIGEVTAIKLSLLEIGKGKKDRSASGRVKEVIIVGTSAQVKLTGNYMRSKFGLKSTLFEAAIIGDEVVFNGYGWGHGVGMSQYGAQAFAEQGYTYEQILAHYYPGTTLKRIY